MNRYTIFIDSYVNLFEKNVLLVINIEVTIKSAQLACLIFLQPFIARIFYTVPII
jgi:hypothetical protein